MGLAERRGMTEFKEKKFPAIEAEVKALAAGAAWDVKWDTLQPENAGTSMDEYYTEVFFKPLVGALKKVGVDAMGKEALAKGLKKIVIDGSAGHSPNNFTFSDGVLTLAHTCVNLQHGVDREAKIQQLLESAL